MERGTWNINKVLRSRFYVLQLLYNIPMLKIVKIPNSVLTTPVKQVEEFNSELKRLLTEMEETLKAQINPQGVGLAAPQVGKSQALFIIKPGKNAKIEAFINPKILKTILGKLNQSKSVNPSAGGSINSTKRKKKKVRLEGCLSIPKIWGPVHRAERVLLSYQDETGKSIKKWYSGFKSVIIQHDLDHLQGILFTQRTLEQKNQLYEEQDGN